VLSSLTARWTAMRIVAPVRGSKTGESGEQTAPTPSRKGAVALRPKRSSLHLALKGTLRKCRHFFMAQGCGVIRKTHRHRVASYPARAG
jgi:hypothetical protein